MKARYWIAAAALVFAGAGLGGAALADTPAANPAAKPAVSCFFSRDWNGWHAPDEKTIYLRVGVRDIYKVDLSSGSSLLLWPDSHLVSIERGTDEICQPIDLDLTVSDVDGYVRDPLFVKAITKLTPEQVAAIPKKDLP
jgi:hypothetical protein